MVGVFNVVLRVKPGTTLPDEFAPFPPDGLIRTNGWDWGEPDRISG